MLDLFARNSAVTNNIKEVGYVFCYLYLACMPKCAKQFKTEPAQVGTGTLSFYEH